MATVEQFCKVFNANIIRKEFNVSESTLTGTIEFKKHEGQGTEKERISIKVNGEWYGYFPANEKADEVTTQVLRESAQGDEISLEFYKNQKGFLNVSRALKVTDVSKDGTEKPKSETTKSSSGWTKKSGGGGWGGKTSYPPKEVEEAKYPAFSASYAKDMVVALIEKGLVKDGGEAGAHFVHIFTVTYNTLKGTKE